MPYISKVINTYQIHYQGLSDVQAVVPCYAGTGELIGQLAFYDDTRPVPVRNTYLGTSTTPGMAFKASQFMAVLNLLREEKPLYFQFNTDNMTGTLSTTNEPVGEDEGP